MVLYRQITVIGILCCLFLQVATKRIRTLGEMVRYEWQEGVRVLHKECFSTSECRGKGREVHASVVWKWCCCSREDVSEACEGVRQEGSRLCRGDATATIRGRSP